MGNLGNVVGREGGGCSKPYKQGLDGEQVGTWGSLHNPHQGLLPTQNPGRWAGRGPEPAGQASYLDWIPGSQSQDAVPILSLDRGSTSRGSVQGMGPSCELCQGPALGSFLSDGSHNTQVLNTWLMGQRGTGFGVCVGEVREKAKTFHVPSFKMLTITPVPCSYQGISGSFTSNNICPLVAGKRSLPR